MEEPKISRPVCKETIDEFLREHDVCWEDVVCIKTDDEEIWSLERFPCGIDDADTDGTILVFDTEPFYDAIIKKYELDSETDVILTYRMDGLEEAFDKVPMADIARLGGWVDEISM